MTGKENKLENFQTHDGEITPQYFVACGTQTARDCCLVDSKCRKEIKILPDGSQVYTGLCCHTDA